MSVVASPHWLILETVTLETVRGVSGATNKGGAKECILFTTRCCVWLLAVVPSHSCKRLPHTHTSIALRSGLFVGHRRPRRRTRVADCARADSWSGYLIKARHRGSPSIHAFVRQLERAFDSTICDGQGSACRTHTRAVVVSHRRQGPEARQACVQRGIYLDGKVSRDHHVQLAFVYTLPLHERKKLTHDDLRALTGTSPPMTVGLTLETTS